MTAQTQMTMAERNDAAERAIYETLACVRANSDAALRMIHEAIAQMKASNEATVLMAQEATARLDADREKMRVEHLASMASTKQHQAQMQEIVARLQDRMDHFYDPPEQKQQVN